MPDYNALGKTHAQVAFSFLGHAGFTLATVEDVGTPGMSRSGWELLYVSPEVSVRVSYSEWQLCVYFEHLGQRAEYFVLDQNAFDRRGGYHGNVFPPDDRLGAVLDRVTEDLRQNYSPLLAGNSEAWKQAMRTMNALRVKPPLP